MFRPGSTVSWPTAMDGEQYVAIWSNFGPVPPAGVTALQQTFSISAGGTYLLAWSDNSALGVSGTPYSVAIFGAGLPPLNLSVSASQGTPTWHARSVPVTLAAGDYTLVFKSAAGVGTTLLDGINLTPLIPTDYLLTVAVTGPGTVTSDPVGISCGADCSESYPASTVVTLTPAANPHATFVGWSGACSGNAGPCVLPMNSAKTVSAVFAIAAPLAATAPPPHTVQCAGDLPPPATDLTSFVDQGGSVSGGCGGTTVALLSETTIGTCPATVTRSYRASDACGATADCTEVITIDDTTPPRIGAPGPDGTIDFPATPAFTAPTAIDNCDPAPAVVQESPDTIIPSACGDGYTQTRRWHAVDACGSLSATVSQTIVVQAIPQACQPGYFSASGVSPCSPAPPGYFVATSGARVPTPAPEGFYAPGSANIAPIQAPAGTYCPIPGMGSPLPVPAGYYAPGPAAIAIIAAPAGSYAPEGSSAPILAPAGTYTPIAGMASTLSAPAGYYAPGPGAAAIIPAPPGSYAPEGSEAATLAPAGAYAPIAGLASPLSSAPGYFIPSPGSSAMIPAPIGSYVPESGATAAISAPAGKHAPIPGMQNAITPGDGDQNGIVDQSELNVILANYWQNSPWLRMTDANKLCDGTFQFSLADATAWDFSVLVSTNLNHPEWEYLGVAHPVYQFQDPVTPGDATQRTYRLRWP